LLLGNIFEISNIAGSLARASTEPNRPPHVWDPSVSVSWVWFGT